MIANERMNKKEVIKAYGRSVCKKLNEARMIVREGRAVHNLFSAFKDVAPAVAEKIIGCKVYKHMKKGGVRRTGEIKEAMEGKSREYKKML